jgi:hypothetical protein
MQVVPQKSSYWLLAIKRGQQPTLILREEHSVALVRQQREFID